MTHKSRKKVRKFHFEMLDVFFLGMKASSVAWTSFFGGLGIQVGKSYHFLICDFLKFLIIKTLDPDPNQINTDTKHWERLVQTLAMTFLRTLTSS